VAALKDNQFDLAEQSYRRLLQLCPNHADGLSALGVLLAGQGQIEAALHE
jgi:Flp pilus assembly protein TadD